ncbi:MAG: DUF3086 domain-containing protein [Leptolyngbyaceae bacterium]|nr:DUF3086 domain-containing protein [Leptolyngbyaceae bacterium]
MTSLIFSRRLSLTMPEDTNLSERVEDLKREERRLTREIASLQEKYERTLQDQAQETQAMVGRLVREGLGELEQRKKNLQVAVEQLERRQERIQDEMRTSFAGVSQDLAVRVQGFKDYLVGSLQDLALAAEQLELKPKTVASTPPPSGTPLNVAAAPPESAPIVRPSTPPAASTPQLQFAEQAFEDEVERIRQIIDQYRTMPDYYGPLWQLRRTFEDVHADRVSQWFFEQGGRGAVRSLGSRLQNILVASAVISILRALYGDRVRALILGDTPERLGEWRRGLQDCLGISRADFGAQRGVVLFEAPEAVAQRADRLIDQEQLPIIIVDEAEEAISLSILQFPLWLAFAPDPKEPPPFY